MLSSAGLRVLSTSTDVHVYAHQTITTVTGMNREVPHNVITLVKNVVDLRKVLRKLHAHLCSAIRSFQIT